MLNSKWYWCICWYVMIDEPRNWVQADSALFALWLTSLKYWMGMLMVFLGRSRKCPLSTWNVGPSQRRMEICSKSLKKRILRTIYSPVKDNGTRRTRYVPQPHTIRHLNTEAHTARKRTSTHDMLLHPAQYTRVLQTILPVILARRKRVLPDDDMCCVETCRSYKWIKCFNIKD
jgi:ribosomal protein L35